MAKPKSTITGQQAHAAKMPKEYKVGDVAALLPGKARSESGKQLASLFEQFYSKSEKFNKEQSEKVKRLQKKLIKDTKMLRKGKTKKLFKGDKRLCKETENSSLTSGSNMGERNSSSLSSISMFLNLQKNQPPSTCSKNVDNIQNTHVQTVPRPISTTARVLRPIVIDGTDAAEMHGEATKTFSCKGIQICVDYFLKRGHTQVTAVVPDSLRHWKNGKITDRGLLEGLASKQHLTYIPPRKKNETPTSDHKFIVELASETGAVLVSNNRYTDLNSKTKRKIIAERLLRFCFAGDILMIPEDPLGRNHRMKLEDFLSCPQNESPSKRR